MRAVSRLLRRPPRGAGERRPSMRSRAQLTVGVTLLIFAILVAFGLPSDAATNGWGKWVGHGSTKHGKYAERHLSAGRLASAATFPTTSAPETTTTTTTLAPTTTANTTTTVATTRQTTAAA